MAYIQKLYVSDTVINVCAKTYKVNRKEKYPIIKIVASVEGKEGASSVGDG